MTDTPRGLTPEEAALWAKVAGTVKPLHPKRVAQPKAIAGGRPAEVIKPTRQTTPGAVRQVSRIVSPSQPIATRAPQGLDSHWERRLSREQTQPDFTLDLHGHNLDQAYRRLDAGLTQAKAMNARLVLVVTGKPRPVDAADRGERRGAIRAKILDWLAAGQHSSDIAAIRKAHRRHGGEGALYIVLKRRR
ncbi:Smr/MutS family protein [Aurantiacibacter sp. D1-12]|uniref:Smr/MutS family protein n=1 Tax=Aurantiacibacter sp. D1-12 TaxID=2993658 RepID=UPI00237CD66A|nr:Smr/MutS family protein [Aurantiacibacter sp. D1-12]MDE1467217.1 Smr/MutS family protein [Aurantiacibacter sp. D1-12]